MRCALARSPQREAIRGKTLYNERGDVMLPRGTILADRLVGLLFQQKFQYAYLEDQSVDDVIGEVILSE